MLPQIALFTFIWRQNVNDILIVNVKGYSGDTGNERVDGLATAAIARVKKNG